MRKFALKIKKIQKKVATLKLTPKRVAKAKI
jgi:hypothetical protein